MAKTIQLTEHEVQNLIIEIYNEITDKNFILNNTNKVKRNYEKTGVVEQAYIDDGMMYIDQNQSMEANMKEVNRLQKNMEAAIEEAKRKYPKGIAALDSGSTAWYKDKHLWMDILAAILYVVGGLTSYAGVGVLLLGAAVLVELYNAYTYYQEEDYFFAGLTASFIIIPVVNMAYVKGLFGPALKQLSKVVNKFIKNPSIKMSEILGELGTTTLNSIVKQLKKNPQIYNALKKAKKWCYKMIDALEGVIRRVVNWNDDWLYDYMIHDGWINTLKKMRTILKALGRTITLAVAVIGEMMIYDPQFPAEIIELIAGNNSFSNWLKDQPKFGLNIWNKMLGYGGNIKGVLTTTPYDCTGKVFVWTKEETGNSVEKGWNLDYKNKLEESDYEFTEENVWREWQNGWRPQGLDNDDVIVYNFIVEEYPEVVKRYPKYMKDCKTWLRKSQSNSSVDVEMIYNIYKETGLDPIGR